MFGNHMASAGDMLLFSETTFKASKENTNTNAREIPIAKLIPSPPRFFCDESERARNVRIMIHIGIEVL